MTIRFSEDENTAWTSTGEELVFRTGTFCDAPLCEACWLSEYCASKDSMSLTNMLCSSCYRKDDRDGLWAYSREIGVCDPWQEDAQFPLQDWKYEVNNDDTRAGYLEWVQNRRDQYDAQVQPR
jgi:hypothetical protein